MLRSSRTVFAGWVAFAGTIIYLLIFTVAVVLQEHVDHIIGYDVRTLRPIDSLVKSFVETVHSQDPDLPAEEYTVRKWVAPVVIGFIGDPSPWQRRVIAEHAALLRKLTGLDIKVGVPGDESANLTIHFVNGKEAFWTTVRHYNKDSDTAKDDDFDYLRCLAIVTVKRNREIRTAVNIIARYGENIQARRCLTEEMTQAIGPGNDNATYRPSIFSNDFMSGELTINDRILVRTLYDPRIKPGMTRQETEPIAREIIEELVEAVNERGETALYQRQRCGAGPACGQDVKWTGDHVVRR